jgi:hypothetical protein
VERQLVGEESTSQPGYELSAKDATRLRTLTGKKKLDGVESQRW